QQTRKRGRVRGGGAGERGHILGLFSEMVCEPKFRRGVDDLGDPSARQQTVHGPGGLTSLGLVLRHFPLEKRHFVDQRSTTAPRPAIIRSAQPTSSLSQP